MTKWLLIGTGGHAKAIVEGIRSNDGILVGYVNAQECVWLPGITHFKEDEHARIDNASIVMGIGGQTPEQLKYRFKLFDSYLKRGAEADPMVHPTAIVSPSATLAPGTVVLAGAIVQPSTNIGPSTIVNTAAIIEHDCSVGPGSHIGPGAIVLGGCHIGSYCMIGAGSVILPGSTINDSVIVKAGSLYKTTTS